MKRRPYKINDQVAAKIADALVPAAFKVVSVAGPYLSRLKARTLGNRIFMQAVLDVALKLAPKRKKSRSLGHWRRLKPCLSG